MEIIDKILPEFIAEEDFPLFLSVQEYTKDKFKEWIRLQIELEEDKNNIAGMKKLLDILDVSASLHRLFMGLPAAPTKINRYGAPWFDLIEEGQDICADVWKTGFLVGRPTKWNIDGESWKVRDKISDEEYIVYYANDPNETPYRLTKASQEDLEDMLHPRLRRLSDGKDVYSWKIQLVEGQDGN